MKIKHTFQRIFIFRKQTPGHKTHLVKEYFPKSLEASCVPLFQSHPLHPRPMKGARCLDSDFIPVPHMYTLHCLLLAAPLTLPKWNQIACILLWPDYFAHHSLPVHLCCCM